MKTQKLYEIDPGLSDFHARVLQCTPCGQDALVLLDRTAFFPCSGGQPGDSGTIDSLIVTDTLLQDGEILHKVSAPLPVGALVQGRVDMVRRRRFMQGHTGEHIVSGLIFKQYGSQNVGFHLAEDGEITVDQSRELTQEELANIETLANAAVFDNLSVTVSYPAPEELPGLIYRSKLELTRDVRLVTIAGIDCCACCAVHVKSTGEVGLIKITDSMRYKGGTRLHMRCGIAALYDYREKQQGITGISQLLSVKPGQCVQACAALQQQLEQALRRCASLQKEALQARLAQMTPCDDALCVFIEESDAQLLRYAANLLKEKAPLCGVFSGSDEAGYRYVISSETVDLRTLRAPLLAALNGRGGGSAEMLQGEVHADKADILEFFVAQSGKRK